MDITDTNDNQEEDPFDFIRDDGTESPFDFTENNEAENSFDFTEDNETENSFDFSDDSRDQQEELRKFVDELPLLSPAAIADELEKSGYKGQVPQRRA
ncbi:MAG: hypothetical protein M3430_08195, partial [Acidobacteriota bacterium]|nr:hypothetical protein [Acidobacteriota bacterium]